MRRGRYDVFCFRMCFMEGGKLTLDNVGGQDILRLGEDELPYVSV